MEVGIVGLPSVGKTTLFNALTGAHAEAFSEKAHLGVANIPDPRLETIAGFIPTQKIIPATLQLVDIPGVPLESGAKKLNSFLEQIRQVDAICHVVRCFDDGTGVIDAAGDIEKMETELVLADLVVAEGAKDKATRTARTGDADAKTRVTVLERVVLMLEEGNAIRSEEAWSDAERQILSSYGFITAKPVLFIANTDEDDLAGVAPPAAAVRKRAEETGCGAVALCAKLEAELSELAPEDRAEMIESLGVSEPAVGPMARSAHFVLGLRTFYTAGPKEVRAWTVRAGASAPEAAGAIHSDIQRGFIRAERYHVDDLVAHKNEKAIREAGKMRSEGKQYAVADGDVVHFLFNVELELDEEDAQARRRPMDLTQTGPGMFHRRLILIAAVMLCATLLLGAQLVRHSVVNGAENLAKAEKTLHRSSLLPTYRGSILDRRGRKLAVDRPGYAIAVDYDVITGEWEWGRARRQARKLLGQRWDTLSPEAKESATRRVLPEWTARTDVIWDAIRKYGGLDEEELAEKRAEVQRDVEGGAERTWARQRREKVKLFGDEGGELVFNKSPLLEHVQAHVLLPSVSDETAFAFRTLEGEISEKFEVQSALRREYPWTSARVPIDRSSLPRPLASQRSLTVRVIGVADHIVGSMRDVTAVDVTRRPFRDPATGVVDYGGYQRVGDRAGDRGLERSREHELRGTRGHVERRVDEQREEHRTPPEPGRDVTLTIDITLQARIQALLSDEIGLATVQEFHRSKLLPVGWPLNAAAVVIEVETGEILALVSMPTRAMGRLMAKVDPIRFELDQSWYNRPVEAIYPPGSIIKPLVLCAAIGEGVHRLREPINCTGAYFPDRLRPRCWLYREVYGFATHEDVVAERAIAESCNVYFYTLADRLGMSALADWYRRFGMGAYPDIGLLYSEMREGGVVVDIGESEGSLPSEEMIAKIDAHDRRNQLLIMGIGQGPVTWTPVQAANAYAILARGGVIRRPTILRNDTRPLRGDAARENIHIDSEVVAAVLDGLRGSVMDHRGTGNHITYAPGDEEPIFNAEGVLVWAKTGTAQAPPLRLGDTDGDGRIGRDDEQLTGIDHAWCVGLAGSAATKRPQYAIAVLVEYGGSGGRVAGPIANQIVRALQDEGYLASAETTAAAGSGSEPGMGSGFAFASGGVFGAAGDSGVGEGSTSP